MQYRWLGAFVVLRAAATCERYSDNPYGCTGTCDCVSFTVLPTSAMSDANTSQVRKFGSNSEYATTKCCPSQSIAGSIWSIAWKPEFSSADRFAPPSGVLPSRTATQMSFCPPAV